jgi:hypothetical protein
MGGAREWAARVTAPGVRHLWLAALRVALVPVVLLNLAHREPRALHRVEPFIDLAAITAIVGSNDPPDDLLVRRAARAGA